MPVAVQPSLNSPPHSITSGQTVLAVVTIHVDYTDTSNNDKMTLTSSMRFTSTSASTNSLTISIFFCLVAISRGVWPLCGKCNNILQKIFCSFWHTILETFGLAPALRRIMAVWLSLQAMASVSAVSQSYKHKKFNHDIVADSILLVSMLPWPWKLFPDHSVLKS